jgi:hypothetical protein
MIQYASQVKLTSKIIQTVADATEKSNKLFNYHLFFSPKNASDGFGLAFIQPNSPPDFSPLEALFESNLLPV